MENKKREKNHHAIRNLKQHMQQPVNAPNSQEREANEYMHHNSTLATSIKLKTYSSVVVQERMR